MAEIFAVQLHDTGNPQCFGRVTVRCPYCAQLHGHRVFDNDRIQFTRTALCTGDNPVLRYRVDLALQIADRAASHWHPCGRATSTPTVVETDVVIRSQAGI
ncbi:hypothetical protein H7I77_16230 [Mycolicibacterium novocastrense]|uniref:Uncharacterized protein n=1 Tax=Mycolicibacterium novocastrense TaxID=59813 RepID=A0AAW5SMM6_MYCNV|nr:hypothetical protein [Mycolicibacterium novocastrense]MCV7024872.1 hypothetical protein [Mycolicibacterium novocastrense]